MVAFPGSNVVQALQGVVSGVGFLGAGLILHGSRSNDVHGLTTAASVWFVAAVGAILGIGAWFISASATLLGLGVLLFGGALEKRFEKEAETNEARRLSEGQKNKGGENIGT